jgi:hypothetical protein
MMRKVLISAAAVSTLAFAAPAAAQYYPAPPPPQAYGYNGYGHNGYGSVRSLQVRIDQLQRQINRLDRQNLMNDRSADRLRSDSVGLERRLRAAARHGLNPYEANDLNRRLARLEERVRHNSVSRYSYNGYNGRDGWVDRDRDGRNDRYENDRGWDRDD